MKAPIDKLINGGNNIIQIVITRNCDLFNCSNCTQLLPFRKDAREMSLECIEEALHSVADWPGVVACFGGNPCTHSRFEEVCRLWQKIILNQRNRGLWTNDLMKYGAIIKETFYPYGTFNLNVHADSEAAKVMNTWLPGVPVYGLNPINHGGMLLDYRDYGYTEEQWIEKREKCFINQKWSGAIYERDGRPYVYACEVTGALDGVRNQNHGILAEPGWWRWPVSRFEEQWKACVGCGVPLNTKGHPDADAVYDISPSWEKATEARTGREIKYRQIHSTQQEETHELTDYAGLRKGK